MIDALVNILQWAAILAVLLTFFVTVALTIWILRDPIVRRGLEDLVGDLVRKLTRSQSH